MVLPFLFLAKEKCFLFCPIAPKFAYLDERSSSKAKSLYCRNSDKSSTENIRIS